MKKKLIALLVCISFNFSLMGQDPLLIEMNKKLDLILKSTNSKSTEPIDLNKKKQDTLKNKNDLFQKQIVELKKKNINDSLKLAKKFSEFTEACVTEKRLQLESRINQTIQSGISIGEKTIEEINEEIKILNPSNAVKLENFIPYFKRIIGIQNSLNVMKDFELIENEIGQLKFLTSDNYIGLFNDVLRIELLFNNYCEMEKLLINELIASKTQTGEESRLKVLKRRQDEFSDYASLMNSLEKAIKDKNYSHQPSKKCNP